ncbi:MAG: sugar ABC transporter permease [Alsobacter sp.]
MTSMSLGRAGPPVQQDDHPQWQGYAFVAVFAVPFLVFNVLPVLAGILVAFTDFSIVGDVSWVGFGNFVEAYRDVWVWLAFKNVLLYGLIIVPSVTLLGLCAALYVHQSYPLSRLAKTAFFAPYVVSASVIGLIWVWMLDTQRGLLNHYLALLGIKAIPWLTSANWSLASVALASVWWDMGLAFVLLLAALQDVAPDLIEAARIDGANRWQRFRYVTLPQIRPTLSMVVTLQLISTLKIFSQVHVMTDGGPAGSSSSVIHYIYGVAIEQARFGYASAVGFVLFALILLVTLVQRLLVREVA